MFKEGDIIGYGSVTGIVASNAEALKAMEANPERYPKDVVWAWWGDNEHISFMPLAQCFLINRAKPRRKLPDWF